MSDTDERLMLHRNAEQNHPYAGMAQFWDFEVERRRFRHNSYAKLAVGLAGGLGTFLLSMMALAGAGYVIGGIALVFAFTFAVISGVASLWLSAEGLQGIRKSRPLPPPPTHHAVRGRRQGGRSSDRSVERQLLEVTERRGEITPTRAALETSLTVDEAEQLLSELAQKGHLDVRVEGSKLVYSL